MTPFALCLMRSILAADKEHKVHRQTGYNCHQVVVRLSIITYLYVSDERPRLTPRAAPRNYRRGGDDLCSLLGSGSDHVNTCGFMTHYTKEA